MDDIERVLFIIMALLQLFIAMYGLMKEDLEGYVNSISLTF
jgi:hypothetical protein